MTETPLYLQQIYKHFENLGINKEELPHYDPYEWGHHLERYYLWIALGFLTIPEGKEYHYAFGPQMMDIYKIFRFLDSQDEAGEEQFIEHMQQRYGIEVKQPLPKHSTSR